MIMPNPAFSTISVDRRQLDVALDRLADRFGVNVVKRAEDSTKTAARSLASTLDYLDNLN